MTSKESGKFNIIRIKLSCINRSLGVTVFFKMDRRRKKKLFLCLTVCSVLCSAGTTGFQDALNIVIHFFLSDCDHMNSIYCRAVSISIITNQMLHFRHICALGCEGGEQGALEPQPFFLLRSEVKRDDRHFNGGYFAKD